MEATAASLFWIVLCAVVAPLLAGVVPRRLVPEVVLLLVFGVIIGPKVLDLAELDGGIEALRELGLGMLFLLASYEIEVKELTGRGGRRAFVTWLICFALAFGLILLLDFLGVVSARSAVAIAMISTALGLLLPILKDGGLLNTRVGKAVLNHGAVGELGPVVAMALLLGTGGSFEAIVVLAVFGAVAVAVAMASTRLRPGSSLYSVIKRGSETTAQTTVRLVVLLLVGLGVLAIVFDLDVVLGAFAAGFVLRRALPEGDESLENKLDGLAFGLLIPIFFITSGMAIDPSALAAQPIALLAFVVLIMIVRGGPIFLASWLERDPPGGPRIFTKQDSLRIALYGATGLPIIVAVTSVAVRSGRCDHRIAPPDDGDPAGWWSKSPGTR
ncbi:MAG: putative solute/hydrogen antiporter [Propionibacteriaceae bacterium]|nr:putative solute/hydrogen antiporter [Propionibacteriaceae bacterium]